MRKMSKAAKVEGYDELVKERDLHRHMVHLLVNKETPDATAVAFIGDECEKVDYLLYRVDRAHGGVVAIIHNEDTRNPATFVSVDVRYFEDWLRHVRLNASHGIGWKIRDAAEKLENKRREIYSANASVEKTIPA